MTSDAAYDAFCAGYWAAHRANVTPIEPEYKINLIHPDHTLRKLYELHLKEELFPDD